jgi:hypothetical protein
MKMKRSMALVAALVVLAASAGFAQSPSLAVSTNKTTVDGSAAAGEYPYSQDFGKMKLFVNRTADALYVAVAGQTSGWVAFGLGSLRMNGAVMFLAYVDASGKGQLSVQEGKGHSHGDAAQAAKDTVVSYAVKEAGGVTTLEVALKPDAYLKAGQTELDVIYAEGSGKSFGPFHMFRGFVPIPLAR